MLLGQSLLFGAKARFQKFDLDDSLRFDPHLGGSRRACT
jgi:hypothetical protein